jgi:phosphoribosylanthranilate isomerase
MMVKICGITNEADAQAAAEAGAHALGFNFYAKSPRFVTPEQAGTISRRLPGAVWRVGVFVNEAPARIEAIAAEAGLDIAQLHGDESAADLPVGVRIWKAYRVSESWTPDTLRALPAEAFLLDGPSASSYGGTGEPFAWGRAADLAGHRIIVAGGLDAENVREAIRTIRPWGVDTCSRIESAPGRKDHARMIRFIQAALSEEL